MLEQVADCYEMGDPPIDLDEVRTIADSVDDMIRFITQVSKREMTFFKNGRLLAENYALLVKHDGSKEVVKFGEGYGPDGAHAMMSSMSDKCKILLLRRNCHYIPKEEIFNYLLAGCPGYRNFKGAKRQLVLDVESSMGSLQMLIKYEESAGKGNPCSPEIRCMHAANYNKWFKPPRPEVVKPWFSDC
mgnify:CR=1 FL=1